MRFDPSEKNFDLEGIRKKIFKIKSMYNPNLIANLSKEMYDRYIIRESVCNTLLEQMEQMETNQKKLQIYIKKKIKSLQQEYRNTINAEEARYLDMAIEEWKDFLI